MGTSIHLPSYAKEFIIPWELLQHTNAVGWTLSRKMVLPIVVKMLKKAETPKQLRVLRDILNSVEALPKEITYIILLSNMNFLSMNDAFCFRLLQNHERFHTLTIWKSYAWHVGIDEYMWGCFNEFKRNHWCECANTIVNRQPYADIIKGDNYDPKSASWHITEEILSRVAAVLHAPKDKRRLAACLQLHSNADDLICIANFIEERWGSVEAFIGWMDYHYCQ